jgi:thymidine phosphorylase
MVVAQGGRPDIVDQPETLIDRAERIPVEAERDAYVAGIDARRIGVLVRDLKARAGERKTECGVLLHKKTGDAVGGEPVATVLVPQEMRDLGMQAAADVRRAFAMAERAPERPGILAAVVAPH